MHAASLYNPLMTNKQLENTELPSNQGIQIISTKEKNIISLLKWIVLREYVHNDFLTHFNILLIKRNTEEN
jgi:hypothetical protein